MAFHGLKKDCRCHNLPSSPPLPPPPTKTQAQPPTTHITTPSARRSRADTSLPFSTVHLPFVRSLTLSPFPYSPLVSRTQNVGKYDGLGSARHSIESTPSSTWNRQLLLSQPSVPPIITHQISSITDALDSRLHSGSSPPKLRPALSRSRSRATAIVQRVSDRRGASS